MFPHRICRGLTRVLVLCAVLAAADPAFAEYVGRTPPRLSLIEGQVSFWRDGGSDWEAAQVNLPLAPGDYLDTAVSSRAEMQIGPGAFLRADADTQIGIQAQDTSLLRLDLPQGRIALDLRELSQGARIEVTTPQGKLAVADAGLYDVTVSPKSTSFTARQGGHAKVFTASDAIELHAGTVVVAGDGPGGLARYDAPPPDEWDRWNSERTDRILSASSRGNVSDDIYGINDLDGQGTWRDEPQYGRVWVPNSVPADWAPYTTGRWLWDVDYGWSWVDSAPWGWAPYHYGRWVWANSYWGWAPGPLVVAPVYSPALVGFYGPSVGVGIGFPFVSWVALGWGEPVFPWWGPSWFRGHACWGGWGGPTIINNVFVDRHRDFRPDHVKHFHNQDVPNGMVAVRRGDFARRSVERVQMAAAEQRKLRPARQGAPIQPSEAGVKAIRGGARPARPEGRVDVARTHPSSGYSQPETRPRSSVDLPNSRFGHVEENDAPNRVRRPLPDNSARTRPRQEEAALSPRTSTSGAMPGSENLRRPPRPERPQAGERPVGNEISSTGGVAGSENLRRPPRPDRPQARERSVGDQPASSASVTGSENLRRPPRPDRPQTRERSVGDEASLSPRPDPRGGGMPRVERDTWNGTRPVPPQRPLPQRPSRPVQDSYAAPNYQTVNRAPSQHEAPRVEMPPVVSHPRVESPAAPSYDAPAAPAAPRQRAGADYGSRVQQRPSMPSMPSMSMPSHSQGGGDSGGGSGGGSVGGGGGSVGGGSPARPMAARPHHSR